MAQLTISTITDSAGQFYFNSSLSSKALTSW